MLAFVVILSTLLIYSVKCDVQLIDPVHREFSKIDYNKSRMLSTMSPYIIQDECTPERAWLLMRHGAKYPSSDILDDIHNILTSNIQPILKQLYEDDDNYEHLKKNVKKIIDGLINWSNLMVGGSHKGLNEQGKIDIMDFGKRLNVKLKKLTSVIQSDEVEVLSAIEDRCVISGQLFLKTFFEGNYDDIDVNRNVNSDERLKLAKPNEDEVKVIDNDGTKIYVEDYFFKKNCSNTIKRIRRLLFPDHIDNYREYRNLITEETVKTMYYACAHSYYYVDLNGKQADEWCRLFNFEDIQMFEDMHDLQYYYKNGYHLEENTMLGNALTEDMLLFLTEPNGLKFKFFVGHASNCLSLITRFNLFRDEEKLNVDNIQYMKNRKWRSSFMTPFGCNMLVVVYGCNNTTKKVTIYLNEIPIEMVLYRPDGIYKCVECPMDEVVNLLHSFNTHERPNSRPSKKGNKEKKKNKSWFPFN